MTEQTPKELRDAVDLAIIVDSGEHLDILLADVLRWQSKSGVVTEPFATARQQLADDVVDDVLHLLENRGFADSDENATEAALVLKREPTIRLLYDARRVTQTLNLTSKEFNVGGFELVCTLPSADPAFTDYTPADFDMRRTTSALLELCRGAEDELTIVSPYLESIGVKWLQPGIEAALGRGVDVTVVTRELATGEPNLEALDHLLASTGGDRGQLSVYDYYEPRPDSRTPLYTLHSKVVIADRDAAYVGSANFTRYGFNENLEVGTVLKGHQVDDLRRVFDFVIDTAQEVIQS